MEFNMEFSPPKHPPPKRSKWFERKNAFSLEDEEEKPVLTLKPFSAVPHISFNRVKLGSTKTVDLIISNPLDVSQSVQIEKFPSDKGFFIEDCELDLNPKEEKNIQILWAPEKESSYRETIVFKSSTGFKTCAYLLGTSYLPVTKVAVKSKSFKNKTIPSKKSPKKDLVASNTQKDDLHCQNPQVFEHQKENVDTLNSNIFSATTDPEWTHIKFPPTFQPRTSFSLKAPDDFPDSPIRRQTYTINTMLSSHRESEILPFLPENSFSNTSRASTARDNPVEPIPDNVKYSFKILPKMNVRYPVMSKDSFEEELNDSLENPYPKTIEVPDDSIDLLSETDLNESGGLVSVYDKASKHYYFGFTPQNLKSDAEVGLKDFEMCSKFTDGRFHYKSFDVSELPLKFLDADVQQPNFLKNEKSQDYDHEFKKPDLKIFQDSLLPIKEKDFEESLSLHEQLHDYTSFTTNVTDESEVEEFFPKETKQSLFMEIPNDVSTSSHNSSTSDFLKNIKKSSTKKFVKKIQKVSPFKSRTMKSRFVSTIKESTKTVTSKSVGGVTKRGRMSNFMPRKLCLSKPRLTETTVYRRNPFASMNVYYDEHWIEKREAAFTSWLNFILTPNDDFTSEDTKVDSAKLWIESIKESSAVSAPTKEELSLKAFTAVRNLNALRKSALNLYHSDEIVGVIKKIEKEVDLNKITIRKDRATHADLGIKKDILEMLLSYNTLWLRIGLETIYGEIMILQNNSDVLGLSRFIIHRFLQSPEISAKYSHAAVRNYYKKGFEEEIKRFVLKKFFLLVFFLDTAKNIHLIKHDPCLFNKNAKFKSSRDLLLFFSREYLSGEGDITKHLRYLGYKVSYQQSALEEFDFSVKNLAIDLRCGLRLGRVVELLLEDWTIFQMLRINTINRLTKIHNNDVILKALKNASVEIDNNIEAKHITDGDREKTLDLLWQIIFKTQITKLINKDFLKKENAFLLRSLQLRAEYAVFNALRKPESNSDKVEVSIINSNLYKENQVLQLLFEWCQNVCAHYNVKVYNFTTSFSDGRALCTLLHHYHPNILPYEAIKFETSCSYFEKQMEIAESSESCPFFEQNDESNSLMEKLLKNEKDNLNLVFRKFQEIGNIPNLSHPSDMSNTMPDEKVIVTLVAYVNIRLMELSIEIRAARKILHAWHSYKLRKHHKKLKAEIHAVKIIQKAVRKFLERKRQEEKSRAAIKIQSLWRMHSAKKQLRALKEVKRLEWFNQNATVIQAAFRGFSMRKNITKEHQAAVIIQAHFRKWLVQSHYVKLRNIAIRIQQKYKAKVLGQPERLQYIKMRHSAIKLQAYARGIITRNHIKKQQLSAIKIQSHIRMWLLRRRFCKIQNACVAIQQKFRGHLLTRYYSQKYQNKRFAAVAIQKWYRCVKARQHKRKCLALIQASVRMYIARKRYKSLLQNVVKIQTWWRAVSAGKRARKQFVQSCMRIVCIQSFVRRWIAVKRFDCQKKSAIIIQKYFRAYIAKREFQKVRQSVRTIQIMWRSKRLAQKTRLQYLQNHTRIIIVQSLIRRFIAKCDYIKKRNAAVVLQKNCRAFILRKRFCLLKLHVIYIQRKWRATLLSQQTRSSYLLYRQKVIYIQSVLRQRITRQNFLKTKQSAIIIQKNVRMFVNRRSFIKLKESAQIIQTWWRCIIEGRKKRENFLKLRKAAVTIQSMYRMFLCKRSFIQIKKAVAAVELYRIGKIQRKNFIHMKKSVIKMQSLFRGYLCRKRYLRTKQVLIKMQACAKRFVLRNKYLRIRAFVIKIQKYFRAYKLMHTERQKYIQIKNGFMKFQAVFRGRSVRKNLSLLSKKATLIQRTYRRWKMESRYKKLKHNCIIIQKRYRAKLEMRKQYEEFIRTREAVIRIQAFFRCHIASTYYKRLRLAVIKIQSYFRMVKCYKNYNEIQKATIAIQKYYRSYKYMKFVQKDYLKKRLLVIRLQSNVRSIIARKKFIKEKNACIMIQSFVRMNFQRQKYIRTQNAVIFVQRHYRSLLLMKALRKTYLQNKKAAIFLQSLIRSRIARRDFLKQKKASIILQSTFRMHIQHQKYIRIRNAAIVIQRYFCNYQLMRKEQNAYQQKKKAIIRIQAFVRCHIASTYYKRLKLAVIKIQSYFRMVKCYKNYNEIQKATIAIQKYYRSYKYMKFVQKDYLKKRLLVIRLQSNVRSIIARKKFIKEKNACIMIQSFVRMNFQRQKYIRTQNAVIFVQRHYRSLLLMKALRKTYLQNKKAAIFLQSLIRSRIARRDFLKQKKASIILQSTFRMYIQHQKYIRIRNAAIVIQRYFCNHQLMKKEQNTYQQKKKAIIYLQSIARMLTLRQKYLKTRKAIVCIQRHYHSLFSMKIQRKIYLQQKKSVIFLQSKVRCMIARNKFLEQKKACILMQSVVRMYIQCKNYNRIYNATILIQKRFRNQLVMKKHKNAYKEKRKAVIYLQSKFRSTNARKMFLKQKSACILIQSFMRMCLQRNRYTKILQATMCLQKYYRNWKLMKMHRTHYLLQQHAIIVLQSKIRSVSARNCFLKQKESVIKLQSHYRMYNCRSKFLDKKRAALCIQKYYRNWKLMRLERNAYLKKRDTAIFLQAKFRAFFAKKYFMQKRNACVAIQSYFRMYLLRKSYNKFLQTVIFLQRYYRGKCLTESCRNSFIAKRNAAIFLQSKFRAVKTRKIFLEQKNASIVIQSSIRMFIQRTKYEKRLKAAVIIQRAFRSYRIACKVRTEYLLMLKACITVQSMFRMHKCRKEFLSFCICITFIQSKYRAKLLARKTRMQYLEKKIACIKIQSYFRMVLAVKRLQKYRKACTTIQANFRAYVANKKYKLYMSNRRYNLYCTKIQAFWRGYIVRKKLTAQVEAAVKLQRAFRLLQQRKKCRNMRSLKENKMSLPEALFQRMWFLLLKRSLINFQRTARYYLLKRHSAAIIIQAYWRAFLIRRSITDKKINEARQKIKAADSAESNKLKNRTTRSLAVLFSNQSVQSILEALQEIDVCTNLSSKCCERLVAAGGLEILIGVAKVCNRSLPHAEIIKFIVSILLNLAKYPKTVDNVWTEQGSINLVLHIMQVFRSKGTIIFGKCCSLLWIFCQDPCKAETLKRNSNFTEQIRSFHFLLTRKQSLDEKRQIAKSVASKSYNTTATSVGQNKFVTERESLQIVPDWVLGADKHREFEDPILALSCIMKCLDLKEK